MIKLGMINKDLGAKKVKVKDMLIKGLSPFNITPFPFDYKTLENNKTIITHSGKRLELSSFDAFYLRTLGVVTGQELKIINLLNTLKSLEVPVINNPDTMLQNFDKAYLLHFIEEGIPTIPTIELTEQDNLKTLINYDFGTNTKEKILKPRSWGEKMRNVIKLSSLENSNAFKGYYNQIIDTRIQGYKQSVLMQPFIEGVLDGERSVICVGDKILYGVLRHRTSWNGNKDNVLELVDPTEKEISISEKALECSPYEKNHITRIDFLHDKEIGPIISEFEAINPNVWLGTIKGTEDYFIKALAAEIRKEHNKYLLTR